jgi:hypothetical protein
MWKCLTQRNINGAAIKLVFAFPLVGANPRPHRGECYVDENGLLQQTERAENF